MEFQCEVWPGFILWCFSNFGAFQTWLSAIFFQQWSPFLLWSKSRSEPGQPGTYKLEGRGSPDLSGWVEACPTQPGVEARPTPAKTWHGRPLGASPGQGDVNVRAAQWYKGENGVFCSSPWKKSVGTTDVNSHRTLLQTRGSTRPRAKGHRRKWRDWRACSGESGPGPAPTQSACTTAATALPWLEPK